ncbi:MAG: ABC transporter permease [Coprobacillus sp.]
MSDIIFLLNQSMLFLIPLLVVALGGLFSERSGIINIALEGIMVIGAFCGIFFIHFNQASMDPQLCLLLALLIAGISGVIFTFFHAFASIHMKADQTISGTALNIFAPAFCIFVARLIQNTQQVNFNNDFNIQAVPVLSQIPIIGDILFKNTYITTYIGFGILIISWFVLYKTRFGLRLRACGELPQAADSAGISVYKMRYAGTLISGFLAGVGGLIFVIPTSTNFNASVSGYGFLALAVLIFGQWKPWRIAGAALFFGLMNTIAATYSGIPFLYSLGIPNYFYKIIPYIATLVVLAFASKNSAAPKAEGEPYDKGKR